MSTNKTRDGAAFVSRRAILGSHLDFAFHRIRCIAARGRDQGACENEGRPGFRHSRLGSFHHGFQRHSLRGAARERTEVARAAASLALARSAQSSRNQALVSLYLWAKERAKTAKTRSYTYLWDHAMPGTDAERFGAFHTSEVPYVMNTLYMSDRPFTEADRKIADMMSSYWANFAATGDPNGKGLPRWNPVGDKPEIMEVGGKTEPILPAGDAAKFGFFEKFLTQPER